jgi:bifunctional ADP-heptose synthase (sugar kinase/adenylyltransferase)
MSNQIYSMKEGKYVDRPIIGEETVTSGEGETYKRVIYDQNAIMLDEKGRPVYDLNQSGTIDVADFTSSATNPANLVTAASTAVNSTGLIINPNGTVSTSGAGATVVSNSGNVVDNSTRTSVTNISRGSNPHGDLLRSAGISTGLPPGGG